MFGEDYLKIQKSLKDLASTGPRLTKDQINRLAGQPIADQVRIINDFVGQQKKITGNRLLSSLQRAVEEDNFEGVVDLVFQKNSAAKVRSAKKLLGEESELMNQVRDLSMKRIISSASTPDSTSEDFLTTLMSGRHARTLETTLTNYGDETLNEMFGKEITEGLKDFAKTSRALSDEPIKGLGALAPATIATSLGIVGFMTAPMTALVTGGGILAMSKLLRSAPFLKFITRPTGVRPGKDVDYDELGRAIEQVFEVTSQTGAQGLFRPEETKPPSAPLQTNLPTFSQPEQTQQQEVTPFENGLLKREFIPGPSLDSFRATPDRKQVSPILVPNPATRAAVGSQ